MRRYARLPLDADNAAGSFKLVGDALQELGVIEDDGPDVIARFVTEQAKVAKVRDEGFDVTLSPIVQP